MTGLLAARTSKVKSLDLQVDESKIPDSFSSIAVGKGSGSRDHHSSIMVVLFKICGNKLVGWISPNTFKGNYWENIYIHKFTLSIEHVASATIDTNH